MINQGFQQNIETNERSGFRVHSVGGVPFVQPFAHQLTDDQVATLTSAARVAGLGRWAVAEAICGHLMREIGVSRELHEAGAAAAAEKVARPQRTRRKLATAAERGRAAELNRPIAAPKASSLLKAAAGEATDAGEALKRARAALAPLRSRISAMRDRKEAVPEQLLADANRARIATWEALATFRVRLATAERLRLQEVEAHWSAQARAETLALAEARGEEVGVVEADAPKAIQISSRDGLASLRKSGKISAHQFGAGRAYRTAYELAAAGLRIATINPSGVHAGRSAPVGFHRSAAELQRAYLLGRLEQIEIAVRAIGERELTVLRKVAGEGHTIRSLGRSGNAREADAQALVRALEAAVRVLAGPVQKRLVRQASR